MPSPAEPSIVILLTLLAFPACSPGGAAPPDVREAERELGRAVSELEEIAGPRLLRHEQPPLPEVPPVELSPEVTALTTRLAESDPAEWAPDDRARLAEVLASRAHVLSAATARGEALHGPLSLDRSRRLLRAARLLALRDRLALLDGREAEALDGVEGRLDLARRMSLQPGSVGPLLGNAVFLLTVPDLQRIAVRPETAEATLERLDALLALWRAETPSPEAILAREALGWVDRDRRVDAADDGELGADDPAAALFDAPLARDAAELARRCREVGCREAIATLERRDLDEEPYAVIAGLMIPNYVDLLTKLEGSGELARLAHVAVALRLDALEAGRYPEELEGVALALGLSPADTAEMTWQRRPDGESGRLRPASDRLVTDAPERRQPALRPLLTWDLPAAAGPRPGSPPGRGSPPALPGRPR